MSDNVEPPWKISSKGACWCWYDEITDQELLSILKPENGSKVESNGYEYSVIVNDNGTIAVIRKQTKDVSNSPNLRSSKRIILQKDTRKDDRNSRIVDIRFEPLDKIHEILEDEKWEISEYNPVYKTKDDEIVIVLVKKLVGASKKTEVSH